MSYKINKMKYIKKICLGTIIAISLLLVNFTPSYAQSIPPTYKVYGGSFFNLDDGYTTNAGKYVITTANATNITSTSATLNALVNWSSGYGTSNLSTWFEYGLTPSLGYSSLGYANFERSPTNGYANFATSLSKLNPNTLYYFRAAVQGSQGVVYGTTNAFRTLTTPVYTQNTELPETVISAAPTTTTTKPVVKKTPTTTTTKPTTNTDTNFLPITILGWILLIILILILILTIKHLHLKFSEKKSNSHDSHH